MAHRPWVVRGIAALILAMLGSAAAIVWAAARTPPPADTPVPLLVDASLTREGARVVSEAWPIVRYEAAPDGSTVLGAYDAAPDGKSQHVELTLVLGSGSTTVRTRVRWYDPHGISMFNSLEWGEAIEGSVTIDADRPPAPGDDRIVAYDLGAMRDDQPIELRGKVRIPYAGGPR